MRRSSAATGLALVPGAYGVSLRSRACSSQALPADHRGTRPNDSGSPLPGLAARGFGYRCEHSNETNVAVFRRRLCAFPPPAYDRRRPRTDNRRLQAATAIGPRPAPSPPRSYAIPKTCAITRRSAAGWSSLVARRAHNPKVAGSNPAPATNESPGRRPSPAEGLSSFRKLSLHRSLVLASVGFVKGTKRKRREGV